MEYPTIIQGGMGAGVSSWKLARTVSMRGQLGVVSGTAMDEIMARRLQIGDPGGHMRRALGAFPDQAMAGRVLETYFIKGGKAGDKPFKTAPMLTLPLSKFLQELTVTANFAEVFLAKKGHQGLVGINLIEKIQLPNIYAIYGAMLAEVDYVIMGAGIPRKIPGVLDMLSIMEEASLKIDVNGCNAKDDFKVVLKPGNFLAKAPNKLKRPKFLAIISSNTLALMLAKKSRGRIDGFVIEAPTAGGHNACPRGKFPLNEIGEPVYGDRDRVDLEKIQDLGLPFWLAGSFGTPEKLKQALESGAKGIQAGTAFAFSKESGFSDEIKQAVINSVLQGTTNVFTDPRVSPTGFPFKVIMINGSLSEEKEYKARPRCCDLGYLRHLYKKPDGSLGYRCPAEPVNAYIKKGGKPEETQGRKCLCNSLVANLDLAQVRGNGQKEKNLVTVGDSISFLKDFIDRAGPVYSAEDVLDYLLG